MDTTQIVEVIKNAVSKSDACRTLGFFANGAGIRKVNKLIDDLNIDISHFKDKLWYKTKYPTITKICPVCKKDFEEKIGHSRERTTCSHACSNTFFRSGEDNPNFKHGNWKIIDGIQRQVGKEYRRICFEYWKHICAIPDCGWDKVVEVHHIDDDHNNNDKKNLIPLCPNHHRLTVTNEWKDEIRKVIDTLIREKWIDEKFGPIV